VVRPVRKGADFVIHEAFANPALYIEIMNQPPLIIPTQ